MSWKSIKEGDRIQINSFSHKGQKGYVRYKGEVEGLKGEMLGIELDEPTGKNDGAYGDTRYFTCEDNYGVFFRSAQVKVIPDDGASKGSSLVEDSKKPASGLKGPSKSGKDEEDKDTRESSKAKMGLKGPSSRSSGIKKPDNKEDEKDSRASKMSKVRAGSKLSKPQEGAKKPPMGLKKPDGGKNLAQKKEEIRNKVKAKRDAAGLAKPKLATVPKRGVQKFTKPTIKPSEDTKSSSSSKANADDDDFDAEEAKREASRLSEIESKPKQEKKPAGKLGFKKPGTTPSKAPRDGSKSGRKPGATGLSKPGLAKPGLAKPGLTKPGLTKPGLAKPGLTKPGMKKPEDKPKTQIKKTDIQKPEENDPNEETDELAAKIEAVEQSEEALEAKAEALQEEFKAETQDATESTNAQPDENADTPVKRQFKRPEGEKPAEPKAETLTGSNLRMVQKAQLEIKKKDTEISRINEELKELCKSFLNHYLYR